MGTRATPTRHSNALKYLWLMRPRTKERRTQNRQIPPMPSGTSFKTRRMRNFNNPPTADASVAIADAGAAAAAGECKVNFVAWLNLSWQLCGWEGKREREREKGSNDWELWVVAARDEPYSWAWYIRLISHIDTGPKTNSNPAQHSPSRQAALKQIAY